MPLWADKLLVGVGQGSQLARLVSPSICAVLASRLPGQSPTRYLVCLPPSVPNTCTGDPQKALPYCDPHSASTGTFEPCRTRQEDAALTAFGWTKQATYFPSEPLRGFLAVRPRGRKTLDSRVSCPSKQRMAAKSPILTPLRIPWVSMRLHHMVACSSSSWMTKTSPRLNWLAGCSHFNDQESSAGQTDGKGVVSLPSSHSLTSSSSTRYGHHQRGAMPHDGLKLLLLKSSTSPVWR